MGADFTLFDFFVSFFVPLLDFLFPFFAIWQLARIRGELEHLRGLAQVPTPKEREKKVLVPGRGIFSVAKEKRKPVALSEEQAWIKEQDDR